MKAYLLGIPLDEAIRVLLIYKNDAFIPSKNYMDGYKDGYKKARSDFEEKVKKAMYETICTDGLRELILCTDEVQQ